MTSATTPQMRGNGDALLQERGHGHFIGGIEARRAACHPFRPRCARVPGPGNPPCRGASKLEGAQAGRNPAAAADWRPGPARWPRIGSGNTCPIGSVAPSTEPSTNSTIECTMLCGCTTTSTWAIGMSKSQRASIISRPFIEERGGIDGDFAAHVPRGMLERLGREWRPRFSGHGAHSRNGPPDAVRMSRRTVVRGRGPRDIGRWRCARYRRGGCARPGRRRHA